MRASHSFLDRKARNRGCVTFAVSSVLPDRASAMNAGTSVLLGAQTKMSNADIVDVRAVARRGGAAVGFATAAAATAYAGAAPAPGMCWYYTDPSRTQGFWDYCPQ
jgi:hypothetical protein